MPSTSLAAAHRVASRQHWVLSLAQAIGCGLTHHDVRGRVQRGHWRPLLRGVYLLDPDMYADGPPYQAWWWAALLAHGDDACLVGTTGARAFGLQGLPLVEDRLEVALITGVPRAPQRGAAPATVEIDGGPLVVVRQLPVTAREVTTVDGFPVRLALSTVVDAALQLTRARALSLLDSALHQGLVSAEALTEAIAAARGRPGIQELRRIAEHADARAESAGESHVRLACIDGGVRPDELQYAVRTRDGHVFAIGDLAWTRGRRRPLLAEADGTEIHARPAPLYRDRRRGNALTGAACDTVRFTWADAQRPAYIQAVIRDALRAA